METHEDEPLQVLQSRLVLAPEEFLNGSSEVVESLGVISQNQAKPLQRLHIVRLSGGNGHLLPADFAAFAHHFDGHVPAASHHHLTYTTVDTLALMGKIGVLTHLGHVH
jgi:hypothetical protein